MRHVVLGLAILFFFASTVLAQQPTGQAELRGSVPRQPFIRYETTDEIERTITFYISEDVRKDKSEALPPAVWVQGSGFGCVFQEIVGPDGESRIAGVTGHSAAHDAGRGRVRMILVDKPGVDYLDKPEHPGSAVGSPLEFREQHTVDRWAAAIEAAIRAAWTLEGVRNDRVLVMGHSEGGIVACRVAARMPEVSHVGVLAGEGPTQLYSLIRLIREGEFGRGDATPEQRERWLLDGWAAVLADPDSAEAMFFGHPHRRWSSFVSTSPMTELRKSDAAVFIAQGTADRAVDPSSADVLYADLLSQGRRVELLRLEGADHSFNYFDEDGAFLRSDLGLVAGRAIDLLLEDVEEDPVPADP